MNGSTPLFVLGSFVVACSAKVPRLPDAGESVEAEAVTIEAGGKGLNLAVGARRLGAAVDGILAIGDDDFAAFARTALARVGLGEVVVRSYPGRTGTGFGFTDVFGETALAIYPGANARLSAADIASVADRVTAARAVLAQFEIGDAPIREAFRLARKAGRLTLLNPSPARPIPPEILRDTSVLVLNRVEAASFGIVPDDAEAGRRSPAIDRLLEEGPEIVVVTLGREGAAAFPRDAAPVRQPAFRVAVVDTLGAGDAFAAALGLGLAEGRPLDETLARAAAAGALTCTGFGVLDHLPSAEAVEDLLADAGNQVSAGGEASLERVP